MSDIQTVDMFIIGGGINGAGIARDAAGRGLSVILCERTTWHRARRRAPASWCMVGCATWNITNSAWSAKP